MGLLDFIPIVGQVASSIGNAVSTNKTNKTNMAINQMNNEFNAAEAEKARQFQFDMWNRTNEYNSASAQRSRLESSGLNPYLMMNGGSAGAAQSAGSTSPASAASPLSMQRQDFSGFSNALSSALQIANQTKETNAVVQNLQGQKSLADAQTNRVLSEIDWYKLNPTYKKWLQTTGSMRANLQLNTDKQNLDNMRWSGSLIRAQRAGQLLDNNSKTIMNKYLDQGQQLQLNIAAAQYEDLVSSGYLKYQQAKTELSKRLLMSAQAKGQRISNRIADETADSLIKAYNAENQASVDINSPFIYGKDRKDAASVMHARMNALNEEWSYSKRYWNEGLNAINTIGNAVGNVGNIRRRPAPQTYIYGNRTYNNYDRR